MNLWKKWKRRKNEYVESRQVSASIEPVNSIGTLNTSDGWKTIDSAWITKLSETGQHGQTEKNISAYKMDAIKIYKYRLCYK